MTGTQTALSIIKSGCKSCRPGQYILVFVLAVVTFLLYGFPVPHGVECFYLLPLEKIWHPEFLQGDWTFAGVSAEHGLFNLVFAPSALFLSLETIGWLGRIVAWLFILFSLVRIGEQLEIRQSLILLAIILWLLNGQAPVGAGAIIRAFEAKTVAYAFLLFALNGFLAKRHDIASAFLGFSFSFHPAIGLFGGLACFSSLVALRFPVRKLLRASLITVLCSLPGLLLLIPLALKGSTGSVDDWKFVVTSVFPYDLDPSSWPKRQILLVYILLLFNWIHSRRYIEEYRSKVLTYFQVALGIVFTSGLILRMSGFYELLKYSPFHLFPVFVLLFFLFNLMREYQCLPDSRLHYLTALLGFYAITSLGNPLYQSIDMAKANYLSWTKKEDDIERSFKWIAMNTPNDSLVILPPWRKDSWYLAKRAQIASLRLVRLDGIPEWRRRVSSLLGNIPSKPAGESWASAVAPYYSNLSFSDLESIAHRYGASFILTEAVYGYPVVFRSGKYRVYSLVGPERQ